MPEKYPNLSNLKIAFDPLTHPDKRWEKIFSDKFARIIFAGFRMRHRIPAEGKDILMKEPLNIANEIRNKELKLEKEPLKSRLKTMYEKIYGGFTASLGNDMDSEFVEYLLPYLKEEKPFGYRVISQS